MALAGEKATSRAKARFFGVRSVQAEAWTYLRGNGKSNGNSNDEIRGSFDCDPHGSAVRAFAQDDESFSRV